jgi:type II secretory pathway pseudopilin PulG
MKLAPTIGTGRANAGFTLAEALAALVFMAIVISVAVQGVRVATQAGEVGVRKSVAARVAESALNELIVTGRWQQGAQSGSVVENGIPYQWSASQDTWNGNTAASISGNSGSVAVRLLTVRVVYGVQGRPYDVSLSTLACASQ